jgi:hypothetical protein
MRDFVWASVLVVWRVREYGGGGCGNGKPRVRSSFDRLERVLLCMVPIVKLSAKNPGTKVTVMRSKSKTAEGGAEHASAAIVQVDRTTLSSTQLYQWAAGNEIELTQDERNRVSPDYVFVLAVTGKLHLSQQDKNRLRPLHVAQLAVAGRVELSEQDKVRLPVNLLLELFAQGFLRLERAPDRSPCPRAAPVIETTARACSKGPVQRIV